MHSYRNLIGTGVLCLGLVSCSAMSPKECKLADWREVGLADGLAGKSLTFFNERRSDCAEADVRADTNAYLSGRAQGLKTYCQIGNAPQIGLRGETYEGVCPPAIDQEFRRRHQIGFDIHRLRTEITQLEYRLHSLEQRLHSKKVEFEKRLAEPGRNDAHLHLYQEFENEQQRIRKEQSDIGHRLQWTRDQLRNAEWALGQLR